MNTPSDDFDAVMEEGGPSPKSPAGSEHQATRSSREPSQEASDEELEITEFQEQVEANDGTQYRISYFGAGEIDVERMHETLFPDMYEWPRNEDALAEGFKHDYDTALGTMLMESKTALREWTAIDVDIDGSDAWKYSDSDEAPYGDDNRCNYEMNEALIEAVRTNTPVKRDMDRKDYGYLERMALVANGLDKIPGVDARLLRIAEYRVDEETPNVYGTKIQCGDVVSNYPAFMAASDSNEYASECLEVGSAVGYKGTGNAMLLYDIIADDAKPLAKGKLSQSSEENEWLFKPLSAFQVNTYAIATPIGDWEEANAPKIRVGVRMTQVQVPDIEQSIMNIRNLYSGDLPERTPQSLADELDEVLLQKARIEIRANVGDNFSIQTWEESGLESATLTVIHSDLKQVYLEVKDQDPPLVINMDRDRFPRNQELGSSFNVHGSERGDEEQAASHASPEAELVAGPSIAESSPLSSLSSDEPLPLTKGKGRQIEPQESEIQSGPSKMTRSTTKGKLPEGVVASSSRKRKASESVEEDNRPTKRTRGTDKREEFLKQLTEAGKVELRKQLPDDRWEVGSIAPTTNTAFHIIEVQKIGTRANPRITSVTCLKGRKVFSLQGQQIPQRAAEQILAGQVDVTFKPQVLEKTPGTSKKLSKRKG